MLSGKPLTGIPRLVALGVLGLLLGGAGAIEFNPLPLTPRQEMIPADYRTPKFPGGTALRLAMVHDVIHERYLRHGAAWYEKRNEESRAAIAAEKQRGGKPSAQLFSAMDDLAVGLDRLHHDDAAADLMREKLKLLGAPVAPDRTPHVVGYDNSEDTNAEYLALLNLAPLRESQQQEYTAEANLGTALIHGSFAAAMAGDAAARARLRQGLRHIQRSVAINPRAHFGRENWQAIAVQHFLACEEHPELLTKFTLIGDEIQANEPNRSRIIGGSRYARNLNRLADADLNPSMRVRAREDILTDGNDPEWAAIVKPMYATAMPFDEPVLALIGMWTLGGGPNPYSAMALGRIMENIGQRQIAWNAYERAIEMRDQFSPKPAVQAALVAACRSRQFVIAKAEAGDHDEVAWEATMHKTHEAELAWGETYQKAYQDYEAQQIKAGVPLEAANFYERFFAGRKFIASDPGLSDDVLVIHTKPQAVIDFLPMCVLGAAVLMALGFVTERQRVR